MHWLSLPVETGLPGILCCRDGERHFFREVRRTPQKIFSTADVLSARLKQGPFPCGIARQGRRGRLPPSLDFQSAGRSTRCRSGASHFKFAPLPFPASPLISENPLYYPRVITHYCDKNTYCRILPTVMCLVITYLGKRHL